MPQAIDPGTQEADEGPVTPAWAMPTDSPAGADVQRPRDFRNKPQPTPGTLPAGQPTNDPLPPAPTGDDTETFNSTVEAEPTTASGIATIEDPTRVARAASNRVEGNFKTGRKTQHGLAIAGAGAAAIVCLLAGAAAGRALPSVSETLAFDATDDQAGDADTWSEQHGGAFVELGIDGCVPQRSDITGVALDPRTVLVSATDVESDNAPSVTDREGMQHQAETVGVLTGSGFAVVRLETPLDTHLTWGPMAGVSENMAVRVAAISQGSIELEDNTITQIRRTSNGVRGLDLATAVPGGAVVLDANNGVIGIAARAGTFAANSDELASRVSTAVLSPQRIEPVCPAVEVEGDGDGADSSEQEN